MYLVPDPEQIHRELLSLGFVHIPLQDTQCLGGRIRNFLPNWIKISQDAVLLHTVQGLELEWEEIPSHSITNKGPRFSPEENKLIEIEIQAMLQKQAIAPANHCKIQFIGHLFLRPKKDGGMRPVFNMKKLNKFIQYKHFKMEGLFMLKTLLLRNDFMVNVDLKDAYFGIPIDANHRRFLRFQWENTLYKFTCLPFGLSSAPRVFTKLLKPVAALLRRIGVRILVYLDDILLLNQSRSELEKDKHSLIFILQNLGFVINWKKSMIVPCHRIEYLGMIVDSVRRELQLPTEKITKIQLQCQSVLQKEATSVHRLAQLIGTLTSTMQAIQPGPLYFRELQMLKTKRLLESQTYGAKVKLTPGCKEELRWWILHMKTWNGKAIITPGPDMIIQTDASKTGWGAALENQPRSGINGIWSQEESSQQINLLELRAAEFAVKTFTKNITQAHVHLKMDNIPALTYINKMGGTKSPLLHQTAKNLWSFCLEKKIQLTAEYLPGKKNTTADQLSRKYNDSSNWKLATEFFAQINHQWGPLEIDLFADRLNAQTKTYISWKPDPLALMTDAFLCPWKEKCYAFPPFCLIGRCLAKVQREKTNLVLIAPIWQGQYWYPLLLNMLIDNPILLPSTQELLQTPTGEIHPLLANHSMQLAAWLVSGDIKKTWVFQKRLPSSLPKDGEREQEWHTTHPGTDGRAGAINGRLIHFKPLWQM